MYRIITCQLSAQSESTCWGICPAPRAYVRWRMGEDDAASVRVCRECLLRHSGENLDWENISQRPVAGEEEVWQLQTAGSMLDQRHRRWSSIKPTVWHCTQARYRWLCSENLWLDFFLLPEVHLMILALLNPMPQHSLSVAPSNYY